MSIENKNFEQSPLPIRPAAKGLIPIDGLFVFVAGKTGRLNLPGGGLKQPKHTPRERPETARTAFFRELYEELHLTRYELQNVREVFSLTGETTSSTGIRRLAEWTVHMADPLNLKKPLLRGQEITAAVMLAPDECLQHDNMSELAKRSMRTALDMGLINSPQLR